GAEARGGVVLDVGMEPRVEEHATAGVLDQEYRNGHAQAAVLAGEEQAERTAEPAAGERMEPHQFFWTVGRTSTSCPSTCGGRVASHRSARAMSWASSWRPRAACCARAPGVPANTSANSVSTQPGDIAATRIGLWRARSSWRRPSVMARTANFVPAYTAP